MTPLWFLKETFMTSVKKSFHVYFFVNQDLSFQVGIIVVGVHMYILQMV